MPNPSPDGTRIAAIDAMRGIVMILMVVDHAQAAFNPSHLHWDAASMYPPGAPLPAAAYLTRWITHLCAPTFVFLAGTSLAISVERQQRRGVPAQRIDGHLLVRGLFIAALDPFVISYLWGMGITVLQVLYAIGLGIVAMIPLRRLPDIVLLAASAGAIAGLEWLIGVPRLWDGSIPLPEALLLSGGLQGGLVVMYALIPWLAMLVPGYVLGRRIARGAGDPRRELLILGAIALILFVCLRASDGYGNLGLHRGDGSWLHWLHVSKYPPSMTFALLELGIMASMLAWLWSLRRTARWLGHPRHPVLVFGRTALFFYVLHLVVLFGGARSTGYAGELDLGWGWILSGVALVLLYPVCLSYDRYKQRHRNWLTRLL